jgi:branched-chain amino acid transport system permease protein
MRQLSPLVIATVAAVVALGLPFVGSDYAVSFSIQLLIFLVLAYSWNWIGGYTGYTHFGQVSFFGIGAYVGSLLISNWDVSWYLAATVAGLAGGLMAIPLGGAMLRLKGPFFAIGMFGLARVLEAFALGFDSITGGGTGIYLKPISDLRPVYYVVAAVGAVMFLLTWKLDNSRLGLKLLAIREDENAAESLGIPTTRLKIGTFVASAIAPAAMGSLYAVYLGFIDPPTAFASNIELTTIAMVLLGGMGTVLGPLIGAIVLSIVNEVLWANYPQIYLASVGVVVLLAVLFMPRGIVSLCMKSGWVATGRSLFRRLAAREERPTPQEGQLSAREGQAS